VTGLTFPLSPPQPGEIAIVEAFPNLSFVNPLYLTHAPGDRARLFVVEQRGTIQVFPNDATTSAKETFLDIQGPVLDGGERGLLSLAFDPDYATNGYFYVYYSAAKSGAGINHESIVARYQVSSTDPDAADPASETVLLRFDQPYSNHNGGWIGFGPDGHLYVCTGDGGSAGDPDGNGQDLGTVLGKILRIARTGGIPADNPFVGQAGARGEIWAYGMRNPWRASFDRDTGDLWCGDVGQGAREEVDLIVKGGNYGWDLFEGNLDYENPGGTDIDTTEAPVRDYPRVQGTTVIGGYVYRGAGAPSLRGAYVHGDYGSGTVWALVHDGTAVTSNTVLGDLSSLTSFGEDADGEVYLCSFDGSIYRFEESGGTGGGPFPQTLSATGLFTSTAALAPAPGLIEYDVNSPLWSDGASKRRWIALPGTARIAFHATEAWTFPVGTVLV
jgi:glucose/arabinose dehydrogenase